MRPVVLTIAGSDPSGGSGLQADLKTIEAWGCHGAIAVAAVTAQDSAGVRRVSVVASDLIVDQIDAVLRDLAPAAVKIGMLGNAAAVRGVAARLADFPRIPVVCDPVLRASCGADLLDGPGREALLDRLMPLGVVLTPNAHEAARLSGLRADDPDSAELAARALLARGASAVLVKGGHFVRGCGTDVLVTPAGRLDFTTLDPQRPDMRGTGCMLAASIAALLALGSPLSTAIERARGFVAAACHGARRLGRGPALAAVTPGPVGRLHVLTDATDPSGRGHVEQGRLAAQGGADVIQYREKRPVETAERVEVARALREALAGSGARLLIDDRADVAAAAGAGGVHLGRHDLAPEAARAILGPGACVGGTANSVDEALRVAALDVDYLGVGPVFGTRSKANPAPALGLPGLARIVAAVDKPVIAIGGIDATNAASVLDAGAHGIAVLGAVRDAADPVAATRRLRAIVEQVRAVAPRRVSEQAPPQVPR